MCSLLHHGARRSRCWTLLLVKHQEKGDLSPPQMWPLPLLRLLFMNCEDALIERLWLGLEG